MAEQSVENRTEAEAEVRVVIEVGNEYFEPGLTRAEMWPDGRVHIVNRLEGEERKAESRADPELAARLIDQAGSRSVRELKIGEKRGLPDEPRYHIEVYRGGERIQVIDVWRSDLPEHRELADLISSLQTVVQRATDGSVLL